MSVLLKAPPTKAMAAFSTKNPTRRCLWIAIWLGLILAQVLGSLIVSAGEFIDYDHFLITPFRMCKGEDGERRCFPFEGTAFQVKIILGLYIPVVLVAYALLAMLYAARTKDKTILLFSGVCQAASSFLVLTGLIVFLYVNWPFVAWGHMTLWFYTCVAVQVELMVTTALTFVSKTKMVSGGVEGGVAEPEVFLL